MAKLVISSNGLNLREYQLDSERTTIGRHSHNDIVLDEPVVSGEHAAIQLEGGAWVTDLGSTNGTTVNGIKVGKQSLKHNDVIAIGSHELRFVDESVQDFAETMVLQEESSKAAVGEAAIKILNGPRAGEVMWIDKERTALGKPGVQAAVIMLQGSDYQLLPMDKKGGGIACRLNGREVGEEATTLSAGDVIEIADVKLEFICR